MDVRYFVKAKETVEITEHEYYALVRMLAQCGKTIWIKSDVNIQNGNIEYSSIVEVY